MILQCYNLPPPNPHPHLCLDGLFYLNRPILILVPANQCQFFGGWESPVSCQSNGGMTNDTSTVTLDSLLTLIRIMLRDNYSGITRAAVRTRVLKRKEKP